MTSLMERTSEDQVLQWGRDYRRRKLRSGELGALADEYESVFRDCGAFLTSRSLQPASKAFPQRECHSVAGFFMEPIGMGQGFGEQGVRPYVEQALYLRLLRLEFRPKKASVGIGASGLIMTKHMLSRVYERTQIDHSQFADLIHEHIGDFLTGLALAEACGLWVVTEGAGLSLRVLA